MYYSYSDSELAAQLKHLTAQLQLAKEAAATATIRAAKAQADAGAMRWKYAQVKAVNGTLSSKLQATQAALEAANHTIAQQQLQHLQLVAQHAATQQILIDEQTQHFVTTKRLVAAELELEAKQQQQQLAAATKALSEQQHSTAAGAGAAPAAVQHEQDSANQISRVAAGKANIPAQVERRMHTQAVVGANASPHTPNSSTTTAAVPAAMDSTCVLMSKHSDGTAPCSGLPDCSGDLDPGTPQHSTRCTSCSDSPLEHEGFLWMWGM
jgi:hypothetical protein